MVEIKKNRKRWFSIRNKLIAIQLLTVFIILSIYSVINFFNNNKLYKASVVQKLESIVSILGYNCRSPLNFLDQSAAEDILSSLGSEANVVNAWLYNGDDQLFATYVKAGHERVPAPGGNREYAEFSKDAFLISRWIIQDNDIIGTVILKFDMTPYQRVLSRNILV